MRKFPLFTILACLLFFEGYGKHIVGGFMSYTYVSGTTYNFTLTVYRDCSDPSNPLFDGQPGSTTLYATIGVFDQNDNLIQTLSLVNPDTSPIGPPINNSCLIPPAGICVQQGVYNFQVTFPSATEGYTVEYGRCCRNNTVTNVANSGNEGADYWAYVPPTAIYHNNSPVFNSFPPIFICLNSSLVYNNSATDPDGDELRYSLCIPYTDGTANNPIPNPPDPPPYGTIDWAAGYSLANLMGGVPLTIDSITGVLTGTPNAIGQFVVGVCVSEYRNGQLIAVYLRDFQFNVTPCNIPIANIPSTNINASTGIGIYELNCNNYTVTFENNSTPPLGASLIYQWNFGVTGSSADTSSQQYPTFTYPDTGTFLVTLVAISNVDTGCKDTAQAYVKIYPTFTTKFGDENVCQNEPAYFIDSTITTLGSINHWTWNFGDGSTSTIENPSHLYAAGGTYAVTLIDENTLGCLDTASRNIVIYAAPNANFGYGITCINAPVTFTDTSGTVTAFNWNFGDGSASTSQPSPVTHTFTSAGNYTVTLIATSSNGCLDTVSQMVTIHPLPVVTVSPDTTICPFTSTQLSASGGVSYLWSPTTGVSDSTSAAPTVTPIPPDTAVYTAFVTDQNQCVNSNSVIIAFHPIPQINAGPDTSVCLNQAAFHDSVLLTATGGVSYQWSPPTGLSSTTIANPLSKPQVNTTYYVLGTDTNGCQLTDSVTVYVLNPALNLILQDSATICLRDTAHATILDQGASSYIWSPSQYLTDDTSWNTGFYPPDTTNYILTVSNYCYTKSDSILIIVWPLPQLGVNPLDSVCTGNSIQLSASGGVSYLWSPDSTLNNDAIDNPLATPDVNTEYYVTAVSQFGCVNTDSTYILVYLPSVLQVSPNIPFVCQNAPVQLMASGAYTYSWSPSAPLNDSAIANPIATLQDTTEFYVTGTNIHGCQTLDSLLLNVQLPVTAVAPSPYDTCKGIPIQLFASGGFYYSWSPARGLSNTSTSQPFVNADTSTTYIVIVSNDCFSDSARVVVNVQQPPYVDAGPDTTIWRDTYAQLHGTTTGTSYFWNPSTYLENPNDLNTTASPPQTTWYELFATDPYGCFDIDSVLITVEPNTILDIPTGFSPNDDGINDVFHIVKYLNIDHLEDFSVYNRWGERVFSTNNITAGWDGTYAGKPSPQGVYVWIVVAVTREGVEITRKGNVTLIR